MDYIFFCCYFVSFIFFLKINGLFFMYKLVFDKIVNRNDVSVRELIFLVMLYLMD